MADAEWIKLQESITVKGNVGTLELTQLYADGYKDSNNNEYKIYWGNIAGTPNVILESTDGNFVSSSRLTNDYEEKRIELTSNLDSYNFDIVGNRKDLVAKESEQEKTVREIKDLPKYKEFSKKVVTLWQQGIKDNVNFQILLNNSDMLYDEAFKNIKEKLPDVSEKLLKSVIAEPINNSIFKANEKIKEPDTAKTQDITDKVENDKKEGAKNADNQENKQFRGRLFDKSKGDNGAYVTVQANKISDIQAMMKSMYAKKEETGHYYNNITYIDQLDNNGKYNNIARYDAEKGVDISKVNLKLPYITGESFESRLAVLKEAKNQGLINFDSKNKTWYTTKDKMADLPDKIKQYVPESYTKDCKYTFYEGHKASVHYASNKEEAFNSIEDWNKARPDSSKINEVYISERNSETGKLSTGILYDTSTKQPKGQTIEVEKPNFELSKDTDKDFNSMVDDKSTNGLVEKPARKPRQPKAKTQGEEKTPTKPKTKAKTTKKKDEPEK